MSDIKVSTCDWCLREAPVEAIGEKLWRSWNLISTEVPIEASHRNICERCRSHYKDFSIYIKRCDAHACLVDEIRSGGPVKCEPSIDINCNRFIKGEIPNGKESHRETSAASGRVVVEQVLGWSNLPDEPKLFDSDEEAPSSVRPRRELPTDGSVAVAGVGGISRQRACPYCDKVFAHLSRFKIHLRTHTGERPFKCSYCDKTFVQSGNLDYHLRVHTGEKAFKCSCCGKAFAYSGILKRHLRIHAGDKPFGCPHCDKSFGESGCLKRHIRIHTRDKPSKRSRRDEASSIE